MLIINKLNKLKIFKYLNRGDGLPSETGTFDLGEEMTPKHRSVTTNLDLTYSFFYFTKVRLVLTPDVFTRAFSPAVPFQVNASTVADFQSGSCYH